MKTEQQKLDLNSDKKSSNPWFLEVQRRNLIRLLAGGVIGPRHVIAKYRMGDILGLSSDSVLLFKDGFSLSELEGQIDGEESGVQDIQTLLEIDQNFAEKYLPAEFHVGDSSELMQMPFVAPITAACKVHFQSEQDLADFSARQFENVSVDKIPTSISSDLFAHERDTPLKDQVIKKTSVDTESEEALKLSAKLADRLVGGLAMLAHTLPGQKGWVAAFTQVLERLPECFSESSEDVSQQSEFLSKFNDTLLESLGELTGAADNPVDESLLLSTMLAILGSDFNEGWSSEEFLTEIVGRVENRISEDPNDDFKKWHEFCLRVLKNEIDLPRSVFADECDVVRRAIFLLLLRPEPDAVVASKESGLRAGASVRAIAALLSGMRIGFEALSSAYKTGRQRYEGMAELKSWLLNALWKGRDASDKFHKGAPRLTIRRESYKSAGLVGRARISVNKYEIAEVFLQLPPALREVWNRAEGVGLAVKFDEEHDRLVVEGKDAGHSPRDVFISDLAGPGGDRLVRFWVPCLDVSTAAGARKLTKNRAVSLLQKNGAPSTHARFALDEERGAIIAAVDQVAETMQKEELRSHLSSVVKLVRWFEDAS